MFYKLLTKHSYQTVNNCIRFDLQHYNVATIIVNTTKTKSHNELTTQEESLYNEAVGKGTVEDLHTAV